MPSESADVISDDMRFIGFFGSRADLVFQSKDSCNSCSKEKSSKEAEIMITSYETIHKMFHTEGGQN